MALRPEEKEAARLFKATLSKLGIESEWKPGGDPPDLVFDVGGAERWAVEVTRLYQYFNRGKGVESRAAATEPLIKMAERVQAMVMDQTNSDYRIIGSGPIERPSIGEVIKRALAYIRSGRSDEENLDDHGRVRIRRTTSPVRVGWMVDLHHSVRGADGSSVSSDIEANIRFAIDRVLKEKLPRLESLKGYDCKMLLITRRYFFADPQMVSKILSTRDLSAAQVDTILFATESEVHWVADPGGVFI